MTTLVTTDLDRDVLVVDDADRRAAEDAVEDQGRTPTGKLAFVTDDGHVEPLPDRVNQVLLGVLRNLANGRATSVQPLPDELTTTVAAAELGISRPSLMKLVKTGGIPAHKVGTHTRLRTADVLDFKRRRLAEQRRAFDELRELEDGSETT